MAQRNRSMMVSMMLAASFAVSGCFAGSPYGAPPPAGDAGPPPPMADAAMPPMTDAGPPPPMADAGPPAPCADGCDDGVACTADACVAGTCRHFVDDTACADGESCSATAGCVPDAPPADRFCADGGLIGERVRLVLTGMSGIRSFAGSDITSANAAVILWNFHGTSNVFSPGVTTDVAVEGGTLNVHFVHGGVIAFDSRFANLQSVSTATDDVTAEDRGIHAQVLRGGVWVDLPEGFMHFGMDTDPGRRWGESPDPLVPTGERVGRLLLNTDCDNQYRVYEAGVGTYRAAR